MRFRGWEYDQVIWGETKCDRRHCSALAELLTDGEALCLDCADLRLERTLAVDQAPQLVGLLPGLDD